MTQTQTTMELEGSFRTQYADLVRQIAEVGSEVSPRGMRTREVLDATIRFDDLRKCELPIGVGRGISLDVFAAELTQWLGGFSDLTQLVSVADIFASYSDDGQILHGAYGCRTYLGMRRAVNLIEDDPLTRQATVSIWRHEPLETKDLPCTVAWAFNQRDGKLNMTTFMRSNDVWTGLAYDLPIMARIGTAMACALRLEPGSYTHHAQSLHIYDRNIADIDDLKSPDDSPQPPFFHDMKIPDELPNAVARWNYIVNAVHGANRGHTIHHEADDDDQTPDELIWYRNRLAPHTRGGVWCDTCRYYVSIRGACRCRHEL